MGFDLFGYNCLILDIIQKLELEITNLRSELEKSVSHKEVLNSKLSSKQQEIDVLKRKTDVQQKVGNGLT